MADQEMDAAAVTTTMAEIYNLNNMKAQFSRLGRTTQFFKPRKQVMHGEAMHYKAFTQPYTGVRRTSTSSGSESEFPKGRQLDEVDVEVDWDDLVEYQSTVIFSGLAQHKTEKRSDAVYRVATKLIEGVQDDFVAAVNSSLHQNSDCMMARVDGTPLAADGTTYSQGETAFLPIDGGSIAQFMPGMMLDIRNASDNTDVRMVVKVSDVYTTADGPGTSTGPGIVVSLADEEGTDTNLDAIADNDEIVLTGETDDNIQSFPTWFSTGTVFNITRTSVGSHWAVPHYTSKLNGDSLPIDLDVEEHFGQLAEDLAYSISWGRKQRASKGIEVNPSMVCISTPRLAAEAARQSGDDVRLTSALDSAERKRLFGRVGFEGTYFHSPTLGPVAIQADPVATPHTVRFLEPDSWFWITGHKGNSPNTLEWLDVGGRWHYSYGSNGRLENKLQAGALMRLGFGCDQPGANFQLSGVKSSLESVS